MGMSAARQIRQDIAVLVRPPERISVSEASTKYAKVRSASGSVEPWNADFTPYMIEPMNMLTSREHDAVVFIGPAQSGKTQALVMGFATYIIKCDPSDFMILQTTKGTARDFDTQVVKRAFRDNPELKKELAPGSKSDNTYDKVFKSGSILFQRWPSINEISGKPLKYMLITDYDRMTQNVDGEGSPFALASKRTAKYLSRGMTLAETSPGFEVLDPTWRARFKHEAPPCNGALSLFNMGDMRRHYVQCQECGEYYMPPMDEKGLDFDRVKDLFGATLTDITRNVSYVCSANGCLIDAKHKREMNRTGLWVPEGCRIEKGKVIGQAKKSRIASFWFPGAFAAYSNIEDLAQKYLQGCREYDITGSEQNLKTCINVDFGAAYISRNSVSSVSAEDYIARAEQLPKRMVPQGVRYLIAAIDVQLWGFVVQVVGYGVNYERWVIDRFDIRKSERKDDDGEMLLCDPAAYLEDWDLLTSKVMAKTYPLDDSSGRAMGILSTMCDSGGRAGVTERIYNYWRSLKQQGLHTSFKLAKGGRPKPEAQKPTIRKSYPENTSKNKKKANARGEIPLWILNTTKLKDSLSNDLSRTKPGIGYIHFPDWLKANFFEELTVETRGVNGWDNPLKKRNETFDLLCYADAACKAKLIELKMFSIDWLNPPAWAAEWGGNIKVFDTAGNKSAKKTKVNQPTQAKPKQESWINNNADDDWI